MEYALRALPRIKALQIDFCHKIFFQGPAKKILWQKCFSKEMSYAYAYVSPHKLAGLFQSTGTFSTHAKCRMRMRMHRCTNLAGLFQTPGTFSTHAKCCMRMRRTKFSMPGNLFTPDNFHFSCPEEVCLSYSAEIICAPSKDFTPACGQRKIFQRNCHSVIPWWKHQIPSEL